jgi:hypothetical protein
MITIRNDVQQRVSAELPPPAILSEPATDAGSLAEPNFEASLGEADAAVRGFIEQATRASSDERRACALIVVEGVRLYMASESMPNWLELALNELGQKDIKLNKGDNLQFRVVANLLFRAVTKVRDDSEWADSQIGNSQISRYAQAMAWAYDKAKMGVALEAVAEEIVALGGIRKVADLRVNAQGNLRQTTNAIESISADTEIEEGLTPEDSTTENHFQHDENLGTNSRLRLIGKVALEQPLDAPMICVIYPDGRLAEAPLPAAAMASMVAQWEAT